MPRAAPGGGAEPADGRPAHLPAARTTRPPKLVTLAISTSEPTARRGHAQDEDEGGGVSRAPPPSVTHDEPGHDPDEGAVRSIVLPVSVIHHASVRTVGP